MDITDKYKVVYTGHWRGWLGIQHCNCLAHGHAKFHTTISIQLFYFKFSSFYRFHSSVYTMCIIITKCTLT